MKKLMYILSALVMAWCMTISAQAEGDLPEEFFLNGELSYFCDEYLTEVEQDNITKRLNDIKNEYGMEVSVFMTETEFTTGDIFQDANLVYDYNSYGDGILLYVDNYRGQMQILARVEEGVDSVFTDYVLDVLVNDFVDLYGKNVYYAITNFIDKTEMAIIRAEEGRPVTEADPFEANAKELTLEDRVVDEADLLTDSQEEALLDKIEDIADEYEFDVVVYTSTDGQIYSAMEEADDIFDYNGYGYGEEDDGIIFYVNMEIRDYWFSTKGHGITAFTDYGIDILKEKCQPKLSEGEYYEAFDTYLVLVDEFLGEAENGKPYDTNNKYLTMTDIIIRIAIAVVIAMVIAGIVLLIMSRKMKTAVPQLYAKEYMKKDSFHLTRESDRFLYSNTVRTAIPKSSSGSGGGSSTHRSSSGSSHGGGGGSF
jgi:uncharacterized protein